MKTHVIFQVLQTQQHVSLKDKEKQEKSSECVFSEIQLYHQLLPNDVDVLKIPLLSLLSSLLLNGILSMLIHVD